MSRMGRIVVKIKLTNYLDEQLRQLKLRKEMPRSVQTEALVDTGATRLYLQSNIIRALGLRSEGAVVSKTTNGLRRRRVYQPARLELMGRHGAFQVVEVDDDVPNLLGQIPLEYLDLVVDPKRRRLIPNPEHGDRQMSEEF
jgi:predicted aspartyl protease